MINFLEKWILVGICWNFEFRLFYCSSNRNVAKYHFEVDLLMFELFGRVAVELVKQNDFLGIRKVLFKNCTWEARSSAGENVLTDLACRTISAATEIMSLRMARTWSLRSASEMPGNVSFKSFKNVVFPDWGPPSKSSLCPFSIRETTPFTF